MVKASASREEDPGLSLRDHRVDIVVKASASREEDPGFDSRLRLEFSWSSHTSLTNWHSSDYPAMRSAL